MKLADMRVEDTSRGASSLPAAALIRPIPGIWSPRSTTTTCRLGRGRTQATTGW